MKKPQKFLQLLAFLAILLNAGCAAPAATRAPATLTPAPLATNTVQPTSTATPAAPTITPAPARVFNSAGVELPEDAAPPEQQVIHLSAVEGEFLSWDASVFNRTPGGTFGIHDSCTRMDKDLNLLPAGCDSWEASSDGLTWTFHLPKDRIWSDGTPITAADWVFTVQRYARPDYDYEPFYRKALIVNWTSVVKGGSPNGLGVKKVDDFTFTVKTDKKIGYIPQLFTQVWVVPEHMVKDRLADGKWALDPATAVSAGPYKLDHYTRGTEVVWVVNDKYKGPTPATADKIVISFTPAAERLAAYKKGDLDIAGGEGMESLSAAELEEIYKDPALKNQLLSWVGFKTTFMFFDAWSAPFYYYIVREAFSRAIDRDALINGPLKNQAVAAYSMNPPGFPGEKVNSLKKVQVYDPAYAAWLLSKAGFPNGKGFPVLTLYTRAADPTLSEVAGMVAGMLRDTLNIHVSVEDLDDKTFSQKVSIEKSRGEAGMLLGLDSYQAEFVDGSEMLGLWGGCKVVGVTKRGMPGRYTWYYAEYNDNLCVAQSQVNNDARRVENYQDAENILVGDAALVPLYHPLVNVLVNPHLKGTPLDPNQQKAVTLRDFENNAVLGGLYRAR